jgi:hypothetical protein
LQGVSFFSVLGTIQQEVFDRFNRNALAVWARRRFCFMYAEEMMVEANVSCSKLEED